MKKLRKTLSACIIVISMSISTEVTKLLAVFFTHQFTGIKGVENQYAFGIGMQVQVTSWISLLFNVLE